MSGRSGLIAAVTGGTGFVGSALVARLLADRFAEVRVLTRRAPPHAAFRPVHGDIVKDDLQAFIAGVDVLFHCAGELHREDAMRAVHVEGTRRLIEAARGRVRRWVQLSSVGCYGLAQREGMVDERSPLAPKGEYETTKAESDELVERAAGEGAFACVTLRPSIVFGPGMPNRSLCQLVRMVERGLFFFVGRQAVATYVYVDDVADALIACGTDAAASGTYVLSDDRPMEVFIAAVAAALGTQRQPGTVPRWLARGVAGLFGWLPRFPLTPSRVDALSRRVRYSPERIQRELGYKFRVSIEEGLRRFVAARAAG